MAMHSSEPLGLEGLVLLTSSSLRHSMNLRGWVLFPSGQQTLREAEILIFQTSFSVNRVWAYIFVQLKKEVKLQVLPYKGVMHKAKNESVTHSDLLTSTRWFTYSFKGQGCNPKATSPFISPPTPFPWSPIWNSNITEDMKRKLSRPHSFVGVWYYPNLCVWFLGCQAWLKMKQCFCWI